VHERVPVRVTYRPPCLLPLIIVSSQDWLLYVIAFVAPLVLQWTINLVTIRTLWDAHNSALGRKTRHSEAVDAYSSERRIIQSYYRFLLLVLLRKLLKSRWDDHVRVNARSLFSCTASLTDWPALADLIDRCQPSPGTVDPPFGLSTAAICHQSDSSILKDGFRSFPSGHSSRMVYLRISKEDALTLISSVFCRTGFFVTIHRGKVAFV
jgi:diacylglycerol diphosphate phosphatase/phosphatidate phosphatase